MNKANLAPLTASFVAAIVAASAVEEVCLNPTSKAGRQSITPLPAGAEGDSIFDQDKNQCPGTMQLYRLPPIGYDPPRPSSSSKAGKLLYAKLNCASCHTVEGEGGTLGPPLDGIGGHRGRQWLEARLLDPEQQMKDFPEVFGSRPNIMPHPGVSLSQARKIAQYLLTLPEPKGGYVLKAHKAVAPQIKPPPPQDTPEEELQKKQSIKQGRQLFIDQGCAMCHSVTGDGKRFAPSLESVGLRLDRESLRSLLSGNAKDAAMQTNLLDLNQEDAERIIDFLLSLSPQEHPQTRELKQSPPKQKK